MRRVIYKEYVREVDEMTGRASWDLVERGEATFHQFGVDYEEFESGAGNFSTAILELDSGEVVTVRADLIRFVEG